MTVSQGFDSNLKQFARDLEAVGRAYGKSQKKFLRQEGGKLLRKTKARAKALGTKTGNYKKSIKRGKVYRYNGADAIRVYSSAPHAPPHRGGAPDGDPRRHRGGVCPGPSCV